MSIVEIVDARFGVRGETSLQSKDITLFVRSLLKDGGINWKKQHAHKVFGDSIQGQQKEVIIRYRESTDGPVLVSKPFVESSRSDRTVHIVL